MIKEPKNVAFYCRTDVLIMVGLQYYVNCVRSICVCVCPRYTYKKHLADGIYYVIALEPGSRSGIIGDERSNSGATNPWFPSYIHIYIYIYDLHDPITILPRALCSKIPIHVGPVYIYNRYFFPILIFIFWPSSYSHDINRSSNIINGVKTHNQYLEVSAVNTTRNPQ